MLRVVQRICWNEEGWRKPAGTCRHEAGYPRDMKFGHEEWNLNLNDAFQGHVYGAGVAASVGRALQPGGLIDVGFWAREPKTGRMLLVGRYRGASFLSKDSQGQEDRQELEKLEAYYDSKGIFGRRALELSDATEMPLHDAGRVVRGMVNMRTDNWSLNLKCPVKRVEVYDPPRLLRHRIGAKNVHHRFSRPTYVDFEPEKMPPRSPTDNPDELDRELVEESYYRETGARSKEIVRRHNQLSNNFARWLQRRGLIPEREKGYVDVRFKTRQGTYVAELKTCSYIGQRFAIREALGQLFEYNYYSGRRAAAHWLVVLDEKPSGEDFDFISQLRARLSLPLNLVWIDGTDFRLDDPLVATGITCE